MTLVLELLGSLAELSEWLRMGFAAWRYLLSPAYRHRIHEGWRLDGWFDIALDILYGLAGLAFTLLPALLIIGLFVLRSEYE